MLLTLVTVYLLVTIAIGLMAAKRVQNASDFAIAGRHLPMAMIITTTFATWFGSETVLGIPAKFVNGGLHGVVEDPFGAGFCLIFVGLFFAGKLYRMTLLTISDYFRERYGRVVEVAWSLIIMVSYLGWVSAQVRPWGSCSTSCPMVWSAWSWAWSLAWCPSWPTPCLVACGRWPSPTSFK